jgi:uncharacterized membrane protein
VTGLATLFPVAVTIWLLWTIFNIADGTLRRALGFNVPGLGLVVTVLIIMLVGWFSVHLFGRVVFQVIEATFGRLPFVKSVYPAVKQLAEFLFQESGGPSAFRRVVLVQYPRLASYTLAFVTNEWPMQLAGKSSTFLTLLVPTPPSPFSGPILFAPKEDVIPLNLSVEEALKLVVSGGVVAAPLEVAMERAGCVSRESVSE